MNTRIDLYHDKYITNNMYQEHKLHWIHCEKKMKMNKIRPGDPGW